MITSVIVGHKADKTEAIKAAKGDLRAEFKALLEDSKGYDAVELITSANGRVKRKRFEVTAAPATEVIEETPKAKPSKK
jgi:2C-methyl-D-erythritol 2,4-cyclodiphosphate synthase